MSRDLEGLVEIALNSQGSWNASTNSPALTAAGGGGRQGEFYTVSVAGSTSIDGETDWKVGDWILNAGSTWEKVDHTGPVFSVASKTGAVTLDTADVAEAANLYYTEGRVSANASVAANTAAQHAQSHGLGSADHSVGTLAQLNALVSDGTLDDSSASRTPTAHGLGAAGHTAATLAELNALVSDATLDDSAATRTPASHGLGGGEHASATLAQLNAKVSDGTLIADTDVRLVTREKFYAMGDSSNIGSYGTDRTVNTTGEDRLTFKAPADLSAVTSMKLAFIPSATNAALDLNIYADYAAAGETYTQHTGSDAASTYNVTQNVIFEADISGIFASLAAGDFCGFKVTNTDGSTDIECLGITLVYTV